jgi:hypothetical protein
MNANKTKRRNFPWLTAEGNLRRSFPPKSAANAKIDTILRIAGLEGWKDVYPRSSTARSFRKSAAKSGRPYKLKVHDLSRRSPGIDLTGFSRHYHQSKNPAAAALRTGYQ